MKRVLSYYYLPVVFFLLLSLSQLTERDSKTIFLTILASVAIGLFSGFVLHLVTLVMKKVSK
ncbi:hypothetical protein [Halalkalibacter alkalisediminis]|uniref:Uncharacterized protein n=1 Tax=Halalkalibacter alkalisediminis TaxID=935616 RepID=A0ABV6NMV3_9BACI|nr:hypothetical protein [Halalkalibacter alkalisediminis]